MKTREAMDVLAAVRGEAIVVCALGMAANEWWAATASEDAFYMHGAMGFAASFALGVALALPDQPVWALNADGSLCMNLGCLLTEAAQDARNLHHFVVDNAVYQTVGAVPMVHAGGTDYVALALAAGFRSARRFDDVDALAGGIGAVLAAPGPSLTVLHVEAESTHLGTPPMTYEGPEMKYRFGRALEHRLGITVFGPSGY
jgi:thiamine pyrophosphate-dependent acetolactate synthase large subunit-like protein